MWQNRLEKNLKHLQRSVLRYPPQTGENIKEIRLVCQNSTKKKIQRTFGSEIFCKIKGEDNFIVTVEVVVDKAFFGWLTSMGRNVTYSETKESSRCLSGLSEEHCKRL